MNSDQSPQADRELDSLLFDLDKTTGEGNNDGIDGIVKGGEGEEKSSSS